MVAILPSEKITRGNVMRDIPTLGNSILGNLVAKVVEGTTLNTIAVE